MISPHGSQRDSLQRIAELEAQLDAVQKVTSVNAKELRLTHELLDNLRTAPPTTVQITSLTTQVESLQTQIKALNDAIGQSPDKALAVPLLRKDLDNLKDSNRHELDNTQAEITRVYDQNHWFIGLMVTMFVALLGIAITNFLQTRKG